MKTIIDLHQDLMLYVSRPELYKDKYKQTSFEQIKKNNLKVVIASTFAVPKDENYLSPSANKMILQYLNSYRQYCKTHKEFIIIKNQKDLDRVLATKGLYGLILHIEGLNVFDKAKDWGTLDKFYKLGLRSIGPMWNINNPFGGGTLDKKRGLTPLGKNLIKWCEEKGVLFDFAHMNEKTFWDAAKIVRKPIFISHGNAKSVLNNVRNYSDKQLKEIRKTNGVVGIFFSKKFLSNDKNVKINSVKKHIDKIIKFAGEDAVAIGSDFGGILSGFPEGLYSVNNLQSFISKLPKAIREKIAYKNAYRIISDHLL